jgi:hypothetical protein
MYTKIRTLQFYLDSDGHPVKLTGNAAIILLEISNLFT